MCITELLTLCTLYFGKDDKNKDVQSSIVADFENISPFSQF